MGTSKGQGKFGGIRIEISCSTEHPPHSVKPIVDQLLPHIEKVCGVQLPGINRYLRRKTPVNKMAADAHIKELLQQKPIIFD